MKTIYTTSDGEQFDNRAEAKEHEKALKAEAKKQEVTKGLVNLLTARGLDPETIEELIAALQVDPVASREALKPWLRQARKPRSDAGVPRGARSKAA